MTDSPTISPTISIIIPAKNESHGLEALLNEIKHRHPAAELIVVDDGSDDDTGRIAAGVADRLIRHPYSIGNGAAIKAGARAAAGEILVLMDADGQHQPRDIAALLGALEQGYDMAIGARTAASQASRARRWVNLAYNKLAALMTGFEIADLTSGFRAVRAEKFNRFLYLLPNGFSYPTTITMAFLRTGYPLTYLPVEVRQRVGKSNIRPLKDGLRFLLIILKIAALYSPMRVFLPVSAACFLTGMLYYGYTYATESRFTNMGAVLLLASVIVFMIGILAEQVSALHYQSTEDHRRR